MKTLLIVLGLVLFWVSSVIAAQARESDFYTVSKVIDGDSLEVEQDGRYFQVRLWGIDAPEWGQDFAAEAKASCRRLMEGKEIRLDGKYTDKFDRIVAMVWIGDLLLNEEMIKRGLAWVHIHYCDEKICIFWRELETEARQSHYGLWKAKQPIPPWKWKSLRHGKKSDISTK